MAFYIGILRRRDENGTAMVRQRPPNEKYQKQSPNVIFSFSNSRAHLGNDHLIFSVGGGVLEDVFGPGYFFSLATWSYLFIICVIEFTLP